MMVRAIVLIVVVATAWQTPVRDAPARPRTGTATVTGTVVAGIGTGSEPARRARVVLQDASDIREGRTATTDNEGRFEFRDVPSGRFTVEVYKPGYLTARYGASRPGRAGTPVTVTSGAVVSGLSLRLTRGAAISGTVRDSRGRPMPRVTVSPLRFGYSSFGERRLGSQGTVTTDDRGVYRAWGLPEGEYVVMAVPSLPGSAGSGAGFYLQSPDFVDRMLASSGDAAPEPRGTYAPIYFPGSVDPVQAVTLSLAAGDEREGVDFTAALVQTFDVTGSVRMPDGSAPSSTTVTLTRAGEMDQMLAGSVRPASIATDTEGRFVFRDVEPGMYTLLAKTRATASAGRGGGASTQPASAVMWAMSPVLMSGAAVELSLQLAPAMAVAGTVIFEGPSPPPADVTPLQFYMVPPGSGGALNAAVDGGRVRADGTFSFVGVTPGEYRLVYANTGRLEGSWWVRSTSANGREALDAPLIVGPGENIDLAITFSDRPTELAGVFQDATGRPAPDYFIVVFPADQTYWTPGSRRVRNTRPANDGAFSVKGLPAGEYLVAALTDLEPNDLHARSFLEQLASAAARVTLADGRVTRQDLRIGK